MAAEILGAASAAPETSPADDERVDRAPSDAERLCPACGGMGWVAIGGGTLIEEPPCPCVAQAVLADALRLIAGDKCSDFTGLWRCSDPNSGRTRGARYTAEAWCDACIAQDALDRAAVPAAGGPAEVVYGVQWPDENVTAYVDEATARRYARIYADEGAQLVQAWRGPWTPVAPISDPAKEA